MFGTTYYGGANNDGAVFKIANSSFVTLTITSAALQSNQTALSLAGIIADAEANLPVSIYDGATLLGTATTGTAGIWSTSVTVSAQGVHTLTVAGMNSGGAVSNSVVDLVDASTSLSGGGQTVLFSGTGDAVTLSNTAGTQDTVSGSAGAIALNSAQASISGGGQTVLFSGTGDAVTLSNTAGTQDTVSGSAGAITLNSAQASISGGGQTVRLSGTGDAVTLSATANNWDY